MTTSIDHTITKGWLSQLKFHLSPFDPNQINIIKSFIVDTGLRTKLVTTILAELRLKLITNDDEALTDKFITIKTDLIAYLGKRISRLDNKENSDITDPWMALEMQSTDAETKKRCMQASLHLQDVWFSCREIIGQELLLYSKEEAEELSEFREKHLSEYLKLLPASENFSKDLSQYFSDIEVALKKNQFAVAANTTTQLAALLKIHTLSVLKLTPNACFPCKPL